ncbi:hypothetical protein [Streptomyces roseoviridis]|uniref:Uncharacterized protein n=1 Tax=Streptomyces roseoviridis TaxID=67361 RepID=A0ABV5QPT3_9ACTN
MEQRTGPSIQPLQGAAVDPAFVPGIMGPNPAAPVATAEKAAADDTAPAADVDAAVDEAVDEDAVEAVDETAVADAVPGRAEPGTREGGPVFEAADRRARIVADAAGVRLGLDEENCEFRWDEIGAVETVTARFGKRFTVTVHTPDRRWYPVEIEAPSRARIGEWEARLDAVLDAYFDEGAGALGADGRDETGRSA